MIQHAFPVTAFNSQIIDLALQEDLGQPYFDATTETLFSTAKKPQSAALISKHPTPIILCGLPIIPAILNRLSDQCTVETSYQDGNNILPYETFAILHGPANILLMAERTILNFMQRLCAIATLTRQYVNQIKHTDCKVLDTRKTAPGMRFLEKYAVQCGGGINHRMGLYDTLMLKDTHIDLLGGMRNALSRLPDHSDLPVIIEVRNEEALDCVIAYGLNKVTRVLLDNMTLVQLRCCVKKCELYRLPTEASGNISLANLSEIAETGVNFVSIGSITHSAGVVDLSMQCKYS